MMTKSDAKISPRRNGFSKHSPLFGVAAILTGWGEEEDWATAGKIGSVRAGVGSLVTAGVCGSVTSAGGG